MAGEIFNQVLCALATLMMQSRMQTLAQTCGKQNFRETLQVEDSSFANISHALRITEDSFVVYYDVCETNNLRSRCEFNWDQQSSSMTVYILSKKRINLVCSADEHRDTANSVSAVQLHVSEKVSRSLSLMELTYRGVNDTASKTIRLIRLDVLYPPNITSFTVDGHEVSGNHLINDGHDITVSCSFDKGNPPADFRLLGTNGTTLSVSKNDGHSISHTFKVRCEDEWPTVQCEGNRSAQNRSVSFLVNCPPQFVTNSQTVLSVPQSDVITLRVKSHTTAVSGCLLTPVFSGDTITMISKCSISGIPPYFLLNLPLGQQNIIQGNWTLTIRNEKGSANITLNIIARPNGSGGKENFSETLHVEDSSFANVSLVLGTTEETFFVYYDVCETNLIAFPCYFIWDQQSNNITVKTLSKTGEVICSADEHRDFASSVSAVQLHVSQKVSRSLSLMELTYRG